MLAARRAGDPGSNPGPGENFSHKLLIYDLPGGYSENKIFMKIRSDTFLTEWYVWKMQGIVYSPRTTSSSKLLTTNPFRTLRQLSHILKGLFPRASWNKEKPCSASL